MSQNKMPPDRYSQMIKHLTRKKIKNPFIPASAIQRPKKVLEIEAFQDFNVRNPKAGGGMLVQPSADGSRPGYAKDEYSRIMALGVDELRELGFTGQKTKRIDGVKKLTDEFKSFIREQTAASPDYRRSHRICTI